MMAKTDEDLVLSTHRVMPGSLKAVMRRRERSISTGSLDLSRWMGE
jgi:hypothetical protein